MYFARRYIIKVKNCQLIKRKLKIIKKIKENNEIEHLNDVIKFLPPLSFYINNNNSQRTLQGVTCIK